MRLSVDPFRKKRIRPHDPNPKSPQNQPIERGSSRLKGFNKRGKDAAGAPVTFDNHLGNATAKLGGTVQDLSESLEDLVELASKSKGNGL